MGSFTRRATRPPLLATRGAPGVDYRPTDASGRASPGHARRRRGDL